MNVIWTSCDLPALVVSLQLHSIYVISDAAYNIKGDPFTHNH